MILIVLEFSARRRLAPGVTSGSLDPSVGFQTKVESNFPRIPTTSAHIATPAVGFLPPVCLVNGVWGGHQMVVTPFGFRVDSFDMRYPQESVQNDRERRVRQFKPASGRGQVVPVHGYIKTRTRFLSTPMPSDPAQTPRLHSHMIGGPVRLAKSSSSSPGLMPTFKSSLGPYSMDL